MSYPHTLIASLLVVLLGWTASASAYDYPIKNPYEATVLGTPPADKYQWDAPRKVRKKVLTVNLDKDLSDITLADAYGLADMKLLFAKQKGPAPLIFVIAGTGAAYNSPKVTFLLDTFYQEIFTSRVF